MNLGVIEPALLFVCGGVLLAGVIAVIVLAVLPRSKKDEWKVRVEDM